MYLRPPSSFESGARGPASVLQRLTSFGSNPGKLDAWSFVPDGHAGRGLALVVVLHGCTQTAQGYDKGSGWSELAAEYGFAVLFPEQRRANNPNLCFNWFEPADTRRGAGEALSIAQMIGAMIEQRQIDPERVFITGLSAGGAMTSVMLATYPEMFAGGAIMAGLPHGAAASVAEAFQQMSAHKPSAKTSGASLKRASAHRGRWPTVSIWHGTADAVVSPTNADAIVRQWREVHGLPDRPTEADTVDGYPRRAWRDDTGRLLIEEYRVTGMGHGTPLATAGECGCGQAGAFMLEAGISSTVHSAKTWDLLKQRRQVPRADRTKRGDARPELKQRACDPSGIKTVIDEALRAAGLIK
jgi:poly(hydroxyalkanoate) depolymerase family esterase